MAGIKTVFGGGSVNLIPEWKGFKNAEEARQALNVLKKYGVKDIDTAQMYEGSEQILGEAKVSTEFSIDTKTPGGLNPAGERTKEEIISDFHESLKKLGVEKVDIFYIHAPHKEEPNIPVLEAIDSLHKEGLLQRFGISNFTTKQVQDTHDYATTHNLVPPTVYQGNYNAVARVPETNLFPTLRKLGIAFYAYSPIGGGFLAKTKEQIIAGSGRFGDKGFVGQIYNAMYNQPAILEILSQWADIASDISITPAELAFRWVKYNSALKPEFGDSIIIGVSSRIQLEQTLEGLEAGPLSKEVEEKIQGVWESIKDVAPGDNIAAFLKIAAGSAPQ